MYRSGRLSEKPRREATEPTAHAPEPAPAENVIATDAVPQAYAHTETVRMKEKFTAPFMVYDVQTRRIVPNRQYDRSLTAELRRVQSIILTKLRAPIQAHLSYTPKELLYELEAALYYVCASLAVEDDVSSLRFVLTDAEADPLMPHLESFLAHHNAPAKAVVALAQCLSEGTSHDVLTSLLHVLEQRVQQEEDPAVDRRRSEEERSALLATKNNAHDIAQLVRDVQTAYRSIDTASQVLRRQPQSDPTERDMARSPAANAVPARIVEESFYKVLRWVIAVDADRRALRAAATGTSLTEVKEPAVATAPVPTAAATQPAANLNGFARVIEYDPFTGRLTLERADATQRWGLLLNSKGLLVGVENELRNSSEAGERLYDAVQQQSGEAGGLAIFEVNRHRIRAVHMSDEEVAASGDDIMQKLRANLTQASKTLYLTIEGRKQVDLTVPREVLFEVSHQGGEGGVGQRCLLMMERAATSISWGLKLKYLQGTAALLSDFSPSVRLSNAAKNILFDMRGRLRVLKINHQDMAKLSAAEMKSLISGSLLLTLHLQVTDAQGDVPPEAEASLPPQVEPPPYAEEVTEAQATPQVDAAALEAPEEAATFEDAEATADDQTGPEEVEDSAQAELNDAADLIADEFLKQHIQEAELGAESPDKAEELAAEDVGMVEIDPLEELEWAKRATTNGASGHADDDQESREANKDASVEESPRQQYLEDDDGAKDAATGLEGEETGDHALNEGYTGIADDEDVPKMEVADEGIANAEEKAVVHETAEDAIAAEREAELGIEAADGDAEVELQRKTRGRKKAPAKKAKAATKRGHRGARGGGRRKNSEKAVEDDEQGANANEDEAAQEAAEEGERQLGDMEEGDTAEVSLGDAALTEGAEALQSKDAADDAAVGDAEAEETAGDLEPEESAERHTSAPVDMPLVDLPPTAAEVAIELGRKNTRKQKNRSAKGKTTSAEADGEDGGSGKTCDDESEELEKTARVTEAARATADDEDDVPRVSLNQLLKAKPLTFENDVRLEKFDGSTLEMERTSTKQPWNIKVAFAGDDIIMTKLPPFSPKQLTHPFLRSLGAGPQGEVKWVVDGLNGEDLSVMSKSRKTKALDAIKGTTKLCFNLRALRR
ncbi:hypothetical protein LSCM4_03186 [Leishmania orientalis]|uniref:Uncharacterized protein n=1 Tax=Leishmania orientalis TaxID=2249476 RepID=A0A836KI71_9TRYP|nr:hypothetical protein LSCM4_03186 [Leishmania orientalis]